MVATWEWRQWLLLLLLLLSGSPRSRFVVAAAAAAAASAAPPDGLPCRAVARSLGMAAAVAAPAPAVKLHHGSNPAADLAVSRREEEDEVEEEPLLDGIDEQDVDEA